MFGRKQRRIEQLERQVRSLGGEIASLQLSLRNSLVREENLRALVSKQARELLNLEVKPAKKKRKA